MREVTLSARQLVAAVALAGGDVTELSPVPPLGGPDLLDDADDPEFRNLADQHVLERDDDAWRINAMAAAVVGTCARPEEVLTLRPLDPSAPVISACRLGDLWVQCQVSEDGTTRLVIPWTRDLMIALVMGALTGESPEPAPSGFRFRGSASEAFALCALVRRLTRRRSEVTEDAGGDAIFEATEDFTRVAAFSSIAGPDAVDRLTTTLERGRILGALAHDGYLERRDGALHLSPAAALALAEPAVGGVAIERWSLSEAGAPMVNAIQAYRAGERILVFRVIPSATSDDVEMEWAEVSRAELRAMALGTLVPPDQVQAVVEAAAT